MNKKTLMFIAALTLGGAATANAATPAPVAAKAPKVQTHAAPAAAHHAAAAKPKVAKHG